MNAEQSAKKPDISSAKSSANKESRRTFSWTAGPSAALKRIKGWIRQLAFGIQKNALAVFAVLLAAGAMEFNYYQERLTRDYIQVLLIDAARMSSDMDALDAKLSQLNTKIDALDAKLDKQQLS